MKRPLLLLLFVTVALCVAPRASFGQTPTQTQKPRGYYTVIPLRGVTLDAVRISAAAATTIPLWDYSITSPLDSVQYSGMMVGRSPFFHGARTTDIPAIVVPIKIVMHDSGAGVFDPTVADPTCSPAGTALSLAQASPVLQSASFAMGGTNVGTTQYGDAFQRGNFWTNVSITGDRYHTILSPVNTVAAVTVNVPSGSGTTNTATGGCGQIGVMDINWWQPYVETTIIPSLSAQGVSATTLPLFLFYNVVMTQGTPSLTSSTCCILGYHTAFNSPVQTYAVFDFDTTGLFGSDISSMSHEVGEWVDDPVGNNLTPAWGNVGQVVGCQNDLEVGDPLSGTSIPPVTMPNGHTYNLQELAFFSWFYRQSPSIGVNGWDSDNGTFTSGQAIICH